MATELASPLAVIDALFQLTCRAEEAPPSEWGEKAHFAQALGLHDEENFAKIPCLNDVDLTQALAPFSLVRYRAMVQDVFEPEIYAAFMAERPADAPDTDAPTRILTTKYREVVGPEAGKRLDSLGPRAFGQRGACYCVPIPGESPWAKTAAAEWARARGGGASGASDAKAPGQRMGGAAKRRRDESEDAGGDEMDAGEKPEASDSRKARTSAPMCTPCEKGLCSADDFGLNFPLPREEQRGRGASTACLVKLYDADAESVRVCDTVEIVGVLCVNPELADFDNTPLEAYDFKDARHPSASLVPRLHALCVRKLPFYHPLLPYSPDWLSEARLAAAYQAHFATPGLVAAAWHAAVLQLARKIAGDDLAAKYMLLQSVSRSFGKHEGQLLGAWSLALSRWPKGCAVRDLLASARELAPRAVHLQITGEALNTQKWRPVKDDVANRLVAGQLQLAPGTLVLLDETELAEGELNAEGVQALCAIGSLVTERRLSCNFTYEVKLPLEVAPVVISAQKRPVIKDTSFVNVPIRPAEVGLAAAGDEAASDSGLEAARRLVALVTRAPKALAISVDVVDQISEDFMRVRQEFEVPPELCKSWMCLARAFCLWQGENTLTMERWQEVLEMERERLLRCQAEGAL